MLMDGQVAVFRSGNDTKFFCIGSSEEVRGIMEMGWLVHIAAINARFGCFFFWLEQNELIIASVLDTIFETIATLLR